MGPLHHLVLFCSSPPGRNCFVSSHASGRSQQVNFLQVPPRTHLPPHSFATDIDVCTTKDPASSTKKLTGPNNPLPLKSTAHKTPSPAQCTDPFHPLSWFHHLHRVSRLPLIHSGLPTLKSIIILRRIMDKLTNCRRGHGSCSCRAFWWTV
jgi:hypothetical protein